MTRGTYAETIRRMLYAPFQASRVPWVIHRAHAGDYAPLLREALADRRASEQNAWGLFMALTCSEDVPFIDAAATARDNGRTLLGDYRYRQQAEACRGWPIYTPPADYHAPVPSNVPALLLSGELDPVTPPRWGEMAAEALPNSVHLVIPGGGHAFFGMPGAECVDSLVVRFLAQGSTQGLDTRCIQRIRRPPFFIEGRPAGP